MAEQPGVSFAVLLRQLRTEAKLTQEELAEAAGLSPRSVSDLERGINRTARKDTALLLAEALGLDGPARELFVAVARGRTPPAEVLAAARGVTPGSSAAEPRSLLHDDGPGGSQAGLLRLLGAVIDSPYRGLSAFEEQDAEFFFGREAATSQVLDRMSRHLAGLGLLVVSGVSGAGKSSLLRAGVLPRVRRVGLAGAAGSASWPCLVFTPTYAPLDELALRVAVLAGADAAGVRRGLDTDPAGFALTARQAALARPRAAAGDGKGPAAEHDRRPQRRLLLVVDQFEELFTQCADEGHRRAFIIALHAAASAGHGPDQVPAALVVLGVRADFEARCADYPELAVAVQDRYLVTPMTERQLRMAITEPAKKAGAQVDDDLVEVLLTEVRTHQPGAFGAGMLPLLSHALDQAWRSRAGNAVTLADYERTGGIEGAVAASAQRAYQRLTPAQQDAARQVFTRLIATSGEGVDSADRASRAELTDGKSAAEVQDVEQVLEVFATERLLTLAAGTVELSHEVLLTAWPLLRDTWLADTHADRIVRTRLHNTAAEWERHSRDPSYLYGGSLLTAATDTAARIGADPARHPPLSQAERDFLHASDRAHRRTARRRHAVIAGLLALTVTAVTAAGIAVHNSANATSQHAIALSRQLAAESLNIDATDPVTARRLAVAAWRVFPTDQARSAMTTLLGEQQQNGILLGAPVRTGQGGVNGVAFSPNGKLLADAEGAGSVRLWDPLTGRTVRVLHVTTGPSRGVNGVAFSPDGKLLASADADGSVRLLDPVTGRTVRVLHANIGGGVNGVNGVAFSPDGRLLASADGDLTVRLWDPATGRLIRVLHVPLLGNSTNIVNGVAFSSDGRLLASADGDGTVRLWDPATGRLVRVLPASAAALLPGLGVAGVAFSSDGRLASADEDGTVRLWDPATGRLIRVLPASTGTNAVRGVAFSPDGRLLASAAADGSMRLWDPVTGHALGVPLHVPLAFPPVHYSGMNAVAFSPDGRLLAGAAGDGTVRLVEAATGRPVGASLGTPTTGPFSGVNEVAYSPNGTLLASAEVDAAVRVWDPVTGRLVRVLHAPAAALSNGGVTGVTFGAGGRLLAGAGGDGTVRLWDPVSGRLVRVLHATSNASAGVWGVASSPGGRLLASVGEDGTVRVWDLVSGRLVRVLHVRRIGFLNGVAFGGGGSLLAGAAEDGTVPLWDPVTGRLVRVLHASTGPYRVNGVAFSPNGKLLASAGADGTVRVWDPVTGRPVRVLRVTTPSVYGGVERVAFSPDNRLLASVGANGAVRLWNPVTGQALGPPFGVVGPGVWVVGVAFSPDGRLLASADSADTVRFWNVSAFLNPYAAICADVGAPTRQEWQQYAAGEPQPSVCS